MVERAESRRAQRAAEKIVKRRKPFQEIASALRSDAKLIGSYIERRSLELPPMGSVKFADLMKAELADMLHLIDPPKGAS